MKKLSTLFILTFLFSLTLQAQVNRRNIQKSVSYQANYQRIAAYAQTLEIRDGTLWAWGYNNFGQLGDGTTINKSTPMQIGSDNKWINISAGFNHSLGLKSDGTLWAWGKNINGQLGDGTTIDKTTPIQIGTDNKWVSISAAYDFSLGLKSDGSLWAWGYNTFGQLGDGTNIDKTSPIQIGLANNWISIAAIYSHTFGLKSDGTLWAWGDNNYGQLGDGTTVSKNTPMQIGSDTKWISIGGKDHTLGLKSDGTLWAWGRNNFGQLGDGTTTNKTTPMQIGSDNKWVSIEGGGYHSLGLKSDGTLWAWGYNGYGQLGIGNTVNQINPIQIGTDNKWVSINGGSAQSFGLKSDGTLWAWGDNEFGQLGDGTIINKSSPIQTSIALNLWLSITAGENHSFALKSDGTLWAWGDNFVGQLGDGTNIGKSSPIQMGIDNNWVSIKSGNNHTLGLKSNGTLWAWGYNGYGQLGDGTTTDKNSPVQIGTDNNWVSITAGGNHSLGLKSDGTILAWGYNVFGQLGDGTNIDKTSPIPIGLDNNWVSITAGGGQSFGMKSNGTLWAWGFNNYGQLGDGTYTDRSIPMQIGLDNKWLSLASGISHTSALKTDGTLWTWGFNGYGQLGDGTTTDKSSPIQIGPDIKWVSITAGEFHSLGLKSDGTCWAWGNNGSGQLGDGTTVDKIIPFQFGPESNWISIVAGGNHNIGLKSDRSLFCTSGYNYYGQLGNCSVINSSVFISSSIPVPPPAPSNTTPVGNLTICSGSNTLLTATGTGTIGWYSAATGGSYKGGGGNYTTPLLLANTTYYVQDSSVCMASTTRTAILVTVNPKPTVVTVPQTVCFPETVDLTLAAVTTGSTSGLTFTYFTDAGATATYSTPTIAVAATYYIVGLLSATGCSDTSAIIVTVNPKPTVIITNPAGVCSPAMTDLTSPAVTVGSTAGLSYTYFTDAGATLPYITPTEATAGTYYIVGTVPATGCSDTSAITVSVNPKPTVVTTNPAGVCSPALVDLTLPAVTAGSTSGLTYTYYTDAGATIPYGTPAQATVGTYYIVGMVIATGCSDTAAIAVTINPKPTVIAVNQTGCFPETVDLTIPAVTVGSTAGLTFTYFTDAGATIPIPNSSTIAVSGTYYIVGIIPATGCSDTSAVTITINPKPTLIITNPAAICFPAHVNLTLPAVTIGSTSGLTFTYFTDAGATVSYLTPAAAIAGTYYILGVTGTGCSDTTAVIVTTNPKPSVISVPQAACSPATVNLTLAGVTAGSTGGLTYTYYTDAGATAAYATPTMASVGTYYIVGVTGNGCADTTAVTVTVNPLPTVTANANASILCAGTSLTLTGNGASSYAWTGGVTDGVAFVPSSTVTYAVTGTDGNGCSGSAAITITINPAPIANAGPDNTICLGDTAILSATGGIAYLWTDGSISYTPSTILVNPATTTAYMLTVTDNSGCTASDTVLISVTPSKDIYGHVSYSGGNVSNGSVVILKYLPFQTRFDTVQVVQLTVGNYHFSGINHGNYLIKVFADTAIFHTLIPTYYGNAFLWNDPSVIVINQSCSINDTLNDISMTEELGIGGGPGLIVGQIIEGISFGRNEGEPIPGVDVELGKNPGGSIMAIYITNGLGTYTFSGVPTGNYTIYVDIPGLGRDSSYTFTVDSINNQYLNQDYIADSNSVFINPNTSVGITDHAIVNAAENKFMVYPNPVKGNTTIEYSILQPREAKITLDVYNVLGVKIRSIINANQQTGNYKYNLNPQNNNLNSGVYFLMLSIDGKTNTKRIVVME